MTTKTSQTPRFYIAADMVWDRDGTDCSNGNAMFRPGNTRHDFLLAALNSYYPLLSQVAYLEKQLELGDDGRVAALRRIAELEGALRELAGAVSGREWASAQDRARALLAKKEG